MNVEDKIKHWKYWFDLWVKGTDIQVKDNLGDGEWVTICRPDSSRKDVPRFDARGQYRIKPREFKDGAYYPIKRLKAFGSGETVADVAQYCNGKFYITGLSCPFTEEDLQWIGDELEDALWASNTY